MKQRCAWLISIAVFGVGCGSGPFDLTKVSTSTWLIPQSMGTTPAYDAKTHDGVTWVVTDEGIETYRLNGGADAKRLDAHFVTDRGSSLDTRGFVAVKAGVAAFGNGQRLLLVSTATPDKITRLAEVEAGGLGVGPMVFEGTWLYFAAYDGGVRRFDVSDPSKPGPMEVVNTSGTQRILIADGLLYAINGSGLSIISLAEGFPVLSSVSVGRIGALALYDKRWLYGSIGPARGLAVIDVADPAAPRVVTAGDDVSNGTSLVINGTQLLAGDAMGTVMSFDLKNPETPEPGATASPLNDWGGDKACGPTCSGPVLSLSLSGEFLLVGHYSGLGVFRR